MKYSQRKESSHSTTAHANYAGRAEVPVGPARLCVYADDITAFHSLPPPVSLTHTHTHPPSHTNTHLKLRERGRELMRKLMGEGKHKLVKSERGKREKKDGGVENNCPTELLLCPPSLLRHLPNNS